MATREYSGSAPARASISKQELLIGFVGTVATVVSKAMEAGDHRLADNIVAWADRVIVEEGLLQ
ncbi:MAG: hypothetical protein WCJ64_18820 [Rhodospirillaceae bacterium]